MTRPIAYILTLAVVCTVVVVAQGAEAEKPVTAIQSENARSLEELKVSAASNVEALKSIRAIATEYREQIDYGCAGMGLYAVGAPKGEYLALRLARFCHEHYPDPVKQVIVTVHYGPANVAEVQEHADKPHRAIRVYVEAESDHEALILTERALDVLAGKPQRTLEPEQGRGVPE